MINFNEAFFRNWVTLTESCSVNEIISPLKKDFTVSSFIYRKTFKDGSRIYLTSDPERTTWYFQEHVFLQDAYQGKPSMYESGIALWPVNHGHSLIVSEMKQRFGIATGLSLIESINDELEIFPFN